MAVMNHQTVKPDHPGKSTGKRRALPSDRIRNYLWSLRDNSDPGKPMKLPSIRHIGKELGVSTATIYHVYKKLSREGYIETSIGHGSYLTASRPRHSPSQRSLCIGLNWSSEQDQALSRGNLISEGIFKASAASKRRISIRPLPLEVFHNHTHCKTLLEDIDVIDALIYSSTLKEFGSEVSEILKTYEAHGKPIVRLDPPDVNLTKDFVTADNFHIARTCGYAFVKCGRKRIAYLARESLNATVSTLNTLVGLQSGVALGGIAEGTVTPIFSKKEGESFGYDAIKEFLGTNRNAPDAVYCFSDRLAVGAIRAFREAGLSCPEDVSVIGGTGYSFPGTVFDNLTRVRFSFDTIGAKLVKMTLQRIDQQCQSVPAIYVPGRIEAAKTTTNQENNLLTSGRALSL